MSVLPAQLIRQINPPVIYPFVERGIQNGMSYGLSIAGYDIRCAEDINLIQGEFTLVSSIERFIMPLNIIAFVHDKSTWARCGLAVQNTVIEPGWRGILTLELTNHGNKHLQIFKGDPIAQIIFHYLTEPTEKGYSGKYQDQEAGPQSARLEK